MRRVLAPLLLLTPLLASATIIQVPGDYATIQSAIDVSVNGDTVLVAPGTYSGGFNFNGHHLTLAGHYILTGNENDIDGTILDGGGTQTVVNISNLEVTSAAVIGFRIENGYGTGDWPNVHGAGINVDNSTARISHCHFENNTTVGSSNRGAGIYYESFSAGGYIGYCTFANGESYFGTAIAVANDTYGLLIEYCEAWQNICNATFDDKGVYMVTYSDDVTLYRCVAHHNEGSGFRIWGTSNAVMDHCTSADNATHAIAAMYTGNDLFVTNTIAIGGEGYAAITQGGYNNLLSCTYSDVPGGAGFPWFGVGCIEPDPSFVDRDNFDYHLADDSPCIDAGDPDSPWDPDNTLPDIGAYYGQGEPPLALLNLYPHNPPVIIPPGGGTLFFDAEIISNLPQPRRADGWLSVRLPNNQTIEPVNLVRNVLVPVGTTDIYNLSLDVPALAPAGTFVVTGKLGNWPNFVGISDSFTFEKSGVGTESGGEWFGFGFEQLAPVADIGQPAAPDAELPSRYRLGSIYPNPFNTMATVTVSLPEADNLALSVYNTSGQQVIELQQGFMPAGTHSFSFDASGLASGVYFVRAIAPGHLDQVRKAMLLK